MRRVIRRRPSWVTGFLLTVLVVGLAAAPAGARDLDRSALKPGLTLNEAVQAFGQPDAIEWVNAKGQAVFFLFFENEGKDLLKLQAGPIGGDVVTRDDGRTYLPLGFVTERLAGWGKKYYEQIKSPE
jgi:hypothetical protein